MPHRFPALPDRLHLCWPTVVAGPSPPFVRFFLPSYVYPPGAVLYIALPPHGPSPTPPFTPMTAWRTSTPLRRGTPQSLPSSRHFSGKHTRRLPPAARCDLPQPLADFGHVSQQTDGLVGSLARDPPEVTRTLKWTLKRTKNPPRPSPPRLICFSSPHCRFHYQHSACKK